MPVEEFKMTVDVVLKKCGFGQALDAKDCSEEDESGEQKSVDTDESEPRKLSAEKGRYCCCP